MTSDLDLLRQFARENSQDAFAALVQRHLNLVYSAALRQVRSPQLAEEIAQSVFTDLARNVGKLKPDTLLTAWLYAVTRRTAIDVVRKESRRRLREQIAVEMNNMSATATEWTQIAPLLDDAMAALDATDRTAILLRYFENKSLREVGEALGASEDAAQKRVSRAVERLREFFSKRNVAIGASGLAVLISANAVQSAPVGLSTTILTAIITTTTTLGMTMIHKILITGITAVAVGTGVYSVRLQKQIGTFQQEQATLNQQIAQLSRERDAATNQLAALRQENDQLRANESELLALRSEVTRLRQLQTASPESTQSETNTVASAEKTIIHLGIRFVSVPAEDLPELGVSWMPGTQGGKTGLLAERQFKIINEALKGASDANLISAPQITTFSGRQASASVTRAAAAGGTNAMVGTILDVTPYFLTNSSTFNLSLGAKLNQLTGNPSQPEVRTIQVTNQMTVSPGQTVVLETEIPAGGWLPDATNVPAGPRSLLVFVTPQVVDPRDLPKQQ